MSKKSPTTLPSVRVQPFEPKYAELVASWVGSPEELLDLAPSTTWPLTVEKVRNWRRPGGEAWLLFCDDPIEPIGYAELNPMRHPSRCCWLGHILVRKDRRGKGMGQTFVTMLARYAFVERGANRLALVVRPRNEPAIRCYVRAGFTIVGEERQSATRGGSTERLLRLEMREPPVDLERTDRRPDCMTTPK